MSGYLADTSVFVAAEHAPLSRTTLDVWAQDDDFDVLAGLDPSLRIERS